MSDVYLDFLSDIPIFGGLSAAVLAHIRNVAAERSFAPGEVLVTEGELGHEMLVLLSGRAAVRKAGRHLRDLKGGDCIGEMSLIDIQPRSATVVAAEPTLALVLSYRQLGALAERDLEAYTMLIMNFAREISRRLRHANELLMEQGRPPWSLD